MNQRYFYAITTLVVLAASCNARMDECYLSDGRSQRCLPPFVNAAYGETVIASNTCGNPPEEYCLQTGVTGVTTSCHTCDSSNPSFRHDATFLTDYIDEDLSTWWQSSTMLGDVQYPNMVNLTLDLNKAFDITYVRLRFHTSRPESFAIYKKKCPNCDWQPFQYYSGSCFTTFGLDNKEVVTVEDEQKPLCTDDFSDISPLTGGNVAFSTLESRPSAYNFDRSPVLQDWVKATSIRISLNRINTFGDEVFNDPNVLKSYYYAISDLSIGGRCACNGHAAECYLNTNRVLQCRCEHNTAGRDCERCADMFNDRPWARATRDNSAECQACDCNGLSNTCYFDAELYRQTGHGGHCSNCSAFTTGPKCEQCLSGYYRDVYNRCTACECNGLGSYSEQCDSNGQCRCKPGVGGENCDRCLDGFYGLSDAGCRSCFCSAAGTIARTICDAQTGACVCKLNVEGNRCDRCKPATMNLQESNPYGCTSCFCFGHSAKCSVSEEYTVKFIRSTFVFDDEGWIGRDSYNNPTAVRSNGRDITMQPDNLYRSYFVAPDKFLGSQTFSYNQMLEFELFVEPTSAAVLDVGRDENSVGAALPSRDDIILEGEGKRVTASITSQGNPLPTSRRHVYRFRLHEAAGFYPRLSPLNFQKMLNNLNKIHIRSTYGEGLIGHLDNVNLKSAEKFGDGPPADWVESCVLEGYLDAKGDKCAAGYTRDPPNGGVYAPCIPCSCNGHSETCDAETGVCECNHNTMGVHCELCSDGYYFNGDESRRGTPQQCQPCPCPQGSACAIASDGGVVCTSCPPGHAGRQCEFCMDGWFGDPRGRGPCLRCMCSGNIDENAVMNCDGRTGECLKCIHNTTGFHCDSCLPGYFGNPVTNNPAERCRLCECDHMGSHHLARCSPASGQCQCLPNVEGRRCDRCRSGFWNIASGNGCESCNCNQIGSSTGECDQDSGQCVCLPGLGGQRCERCLPNYYGMSRDGCTACNCNPDGSENLQCDEGGRCRCKEGVLGEKCDRCQDNFYDIVNGCIECPACYGLVQDAVETHKELLAELENKTENIEDFGGAGGPQGDTEFNDMLEKLNETAHMLKQMAEKNEENKNKYGNQTEEAIKIVEDLKERLMGIDNKIDECASAVEKANKTNARSVDDVNAIRDSLAVAERKLTQAMMDLARAQAIADDSVGKEDNMSKIAQEADAIATRHQALATDITTTAQNAYDTSKRAQDSIQEALDVLEGLMNELEAMAESENRLPAAQLLRDELLAQSSLVKNNAEAAKNDSTDLFTEAGKLIVPSVDTDAMDRKALEIQSEADELMPRIDELDAEYKDNYGELEASVARAQELLNLADAAQDTADMLLAQVHGAYVDALMAVDMGNETYQSVLDTKKSLESFDDEINMNRDKALEALEKVDAIQATIDQATTTTEEVRDALGSAETVALQANNKAQQAKDVAENVQTSARNILDDASTTHVRAGRIADSVSELEDALGKTEIKLEEAEEQANNEAISVQEATDAASSAKSSAAESKNRVETVLEHLEELLIALNNMEDVDESEIAKLEEKYRELRNQVDEVGLSELLPRLLAEASKQDEILQTYDKEIAQLRKDVENLRLINDTIPDKCSAQNDVEQP